MKLTLTLAEVTAIVCERYSLPPNGTEIEIKRPVPPRKGNPDPAQRILDGMVDFYSGQPILVNGAVPPNMKIAAIKALRTVVPYLGLGDAKKAVEDWNRFISYVRKNGVPPVNDFRWD